MAPVEDDSIGATEANNDNMIVTPHDVSFTKLSEKLESGLWLLN